MTDRSGGSLWREPLLAIAGIALAYGGVALLKGLSVIEVPAGFGQALGSILPPRINDIAIDKMIGDKAVRTA